MRDGFYRTGQRVGIRLRTWFAPWGYAAMQSSAVGGKLPPRDLRIRTFLSGQDLSGCRYVQIDQIGPDPAFARIAIARLNNGSASA